MAFETFDRLSRPSLKPTVSILKSTRINFNRAATKIMQDRETKSILFLWDKDARKIGFQPIPVSDKRAYDLSYVEKDHTSYTSAKRFLDWIGYNHSVSRVFDVNWNEKTKIFEVSIPKEYIRGEKT